MGAEEEQRLRDGGVPIGWGAMDRLFAALDAERAAHKETLANFDRAAGAAARATNELGVALRRADALEILLDEERAAHRNTREYSDCRLADAKATWEQIALSWKALALAAEEDARIRCRILQEALQEMLAAFSTEGVYGAVHDERGLMGRRSAARKAARAAIAEAMGKP